MTAYIEKFRTSFISGVFDLGTRVWWKYAVVSFIQGVIVFLAVIPLVLTMINWDTFMGIMSDPESFGADVAQNPELLFSFLGPDPDIASLVLAGLLLLIVMMIAQAWVFNVYLKLNEAQTLEGRSDLGQILSRSFDGRLLPLIGINLVVNVILMGLLVVNGVLWFVHWSFGLLTLFPILIMMVRLVLAYAAVVHGNRSIGDALSVSFSQINWRRGAILFGGGFIAMIAMIFAFFMLALMLGVLTFIPIIGPLINWVFQVAISGFFNALMFGAMTGLWYRYNDPPEEGGDQISKHLISDLS